MYLQIQDKESDDLDVSALLMVSWCPTHAVIKEHGRAVSRRTVTSAVASGNALYVLNQTDKLKCKANYLLKQSNKRN